MIARETLIIRGILQDLLIQSPTSQLTGHGVTEQLRRTVMPKSLPMAPVQRFAIFRVG